MSKWGSDGDLMLSRVIWHNLSRSLTGDTPRCFSTAIYLRNEAFDYLINIVEKSVRSNIMQG
jgi:hypothetical protein